MDRCGLGSSLDFSQLTVVALAPQPSLPSYLEAMALANDEAEKRLGEAMLLSWYDRDRDFESPQHASECHGDGAVPGYAAYGLNRGATLKVDVEDGRFVFYYLPLDF